MLCLSSGEACCNCCARNLLFSSKWSIRVGWCDLERDVNAGRTASWCCFGTALREIIETSRDEEGRIAVDKMQSHATSGGLTSFLLHVTWPHLTADEANTNTQQQRFLTNTLCRVRMFSVTHKHCSQPFYSSVAIPSSGGRVCNKFPERSNSLRFLRRATPGGMDCRAL